MDQISSSERLNHSSPCPPFAVAGTLTTRQRPKWLRAKNGTVLGLLTGAASKAMHGGDTFTMVQEVLP